MQTNFPSTSVFIGVLALAGCHPSDPAHPSEKECRAGCERITTWKIAHDKHERSLTLHEADERVDDTEDRVKIDNGLIRKQLAEGDPAPDPKFVASLDPAKRKAYLERREWEAKQLKVQRELSIQHADAALKEAKDNYALAQKQFNDWEKGAMAEGLASCMPGCMSRPTAYATCLTKSQAPEDQAICEQQTR